MKEDKRELLRRNPSKSGAYSNYLLSAELEQPLKRYPYFPLLENMDAIGSHPTPRYGACGLG